MSKDKECTCGDCKCGDETKANFPQKLRERNEQAAKMIANKINRGRKREERIMG